MQCLFQWKRRKNPAPSAQTFGAARIPSLLDFRRVSIARFSLLEWMHVSYLPDEKVIAVEEERHVSSSAAVHKPTINDGKDSLGKIF